MEAFYCAWITKSARKEMKVKKFEANGNKTGRVGVATFSDGTRHYVMKSGWGKVYLGPSASMLSFFDDSDEDLDKKGRALSNIRI